MPVTSVQRRNARAHSAWSTALAALLVPTLLVAPLLVAALVSVVTLLITLL